MVLPASIQAPPEEEATGNLLPCEPHPGRRRREFSVGLLYAQSGCRPTSQPGPRGRLYLSQPVVREVVLCPFTKSSCTSSPAHPRAVVCSSAPCSCRSPLSLV